MKTLRSVKFTCPVCLVILLGLAQPVLLAQGRKNASQAKPTPDLVNIKYGPHQRHVLDLWKADSAKPCPLVVFIHGGGFQAGDKSNLSTELLKGCLEAGISVMAINYRLSPEVKFPAHYQDCGRAIQFARTQAKAWNLDPRRVGASGGSAGAGTSLWLGFHPDLADPSSPDPVLRESTRLSCISVMGAQTSYDPRVIKQWIGAPAANHPALSGFYGLTADELDSLKAHKLYEEASPINFLTADDPPVMLFYSEPNRPVSAEAPAGTGIHHPIFGQKLKEQMQPLKIECVLAHRDDYVGKGGSVVEDTVKFFKKHLKSAD